ncbi:MAG TPA: polyphosphate kinase 1 [Chitinophagaceae bacterium]|nr:polyphosphate kinase 1 [Chitinophagaceae bacterium]
MVKGKTELKKYAMIPRDISWLAFNARVLQEAADKNVPLKERLKFLGIFSNNLDEFFRVRVAALKRMMKWGARSIMHVEDSPQRILDNIQLIVLQQQSEFARIWQDVLLELKKQNIYLLTEKELDRQQQEFVTGFFDEVVRSSVIPLMIESIPALPYLRDKSIYLAIVMSKKSSAYQRKFALIEVPTKGASRFIQLPGRGDKGKYIILLEDVIRFCLPRIFSYFGYDEYSAHIIKVTKDAEYDLDYDEPTNLSEKIEKGIKNRRKGKPVRLIYDKEIDSSLLEYLVRKMGLTKKDHLIPGGRIHNFRHFMEFPQDIFPHEGERRKPFMHPQVKNTSRVTDEVLNRDVMLNFPYHSFDPVIDLLREAAIDPDVTTIKITAYRLADNSKVINALINAVRNGKNVTVMLELRARFDEENNLYWKEVLEEEGVKVLLGEPNQKVHAKICLIRKRKGNRTIHYGFVSTGNLNESTARFYGDICLLTSDRHIMADVNRMFSYLEKPKSGLKHLKLCKTLLVAPMYMRKQLIALINTEIKHAKGGRSASITLKLNSLSDEILISKLYEAALAGVEIKMVIRGIFCARTDIKKFKKPLFAISIVDEYLEHARVMIFHNGGNEKVFISSADWMVRNLDHRVEAACPILEPRLKQEIKEIIDIQLHDNVKARILTSDLDNNYVEAKGKKIRSQIEIYNHLYEKSKKLLKTV